MQVALLEPEIPPNTGNVIRLCANTGVALHLIEPLGFFLDDKRLRRAGLDYHEFSRVQKWNNWGHFRRENAHGRVFAFSTRGTRSHTSVDYRPDDILLFGPESRGLSGELLATLPPEQCLRIPMKGDSRSLNLSNAVAIALYEALRQSGFPGLD